MLQPSGSSAPVAQSEHPADPRSPRAGSSPLLGVLQAFSEPRRRQLSQDRQKALLILGAGCAVRNARDPAGSLTPAVQSGAPRRVSEPQERAARRPWVRCRPFGSSIPAARSEHPADPRNPGAGSPATWMRCRPFRILGAGSSIRAPGRSPNPRSGQLSNLVCHE